MSEEEMKNDETQKTVKEEGSDVFTKDDAVDLFNELSENQNLIIIN